MSYIFPMTPRIMDMSLPIDTRIKIRETQRQDLLARRGEIDRELRQLGEDIAKLRRLARPADEVALVVSRAL